MAFYLTLHTDILHRGTLFGISLTGLQRSNQGRTERHRETREATMRETHAAANATASSSCLPADPAPDASPPRPTLVDSTGLAICPTSSCDRSPPAFGVPQRWCQARVEWDTHTYMHVCQVYTHNSIRFRRTSKFVHTGFPKAARRRVPVQ